MASTSTASNPSGTRTSSALSTAILSRFKPAKIFKGAIDPPASSPNHPNQPPRHITGISFDDQGDTVITAGEDETFRLYNCRTGKHIKTLYSKKYGIDLPRFTHKNSTIIYASRKEDDTIRYHSLHDNKYLQYFKGHTKSVTSLEVSPLDDGFISGSLDNTVRLWDLRTPNCRGLLKLPASPVVAYDCSGLVFATAINHYQKVLLYDMKNFDKEPFMSFDIDDTALAKVSFPPRHPVITSLSFSTNGKWLLVGTAGDCHYVVDAFDGRLLCKLEGYVGLERGKQSKSVDVVPVRGISGDELGWTQDSKFIVGGSHVGKVHFWDASNIPVEPGPEGEDPKVLLPVVNLDGHPGPSRCVKMNPRYQMMVTAGAELAFWLSDNSQDGDGAKSDDEGKGKEKLK